MIRQCMAQRYGHLKSAIVLILLTPLLMPFSSAQIGIASVSLDCGDDPIMNVNPAEYQDVDLICTITNDGQFLAEEIKILDEWDGNPTVAMMLSEDTFTLDTGEEEDFTVTFIGDSKIDASFESMRWT